VAPSANAFAIRCATVSVSVCEDELHAVGGELGPQLVGVLDDAVVDDGDALRGVDLRVGVLDGGLAVRGPARVPDAGGALEARREVRGEVGDPAFRLADLEPGARAHRDPRES
jgi:hypothetical protein